MKTIKNLLSLSFLILLTYSCEPEELPQTNPLIIDNVSADTGDQGEEPENRGKD